MSQKMRPLAGRWTAKNARPLGAAMALAVAAAGVALVAPQARVAQAADVAPAVDHVSFSRQIRPLLADRCFTCHGPDSATRKASLRLDLQDGLFAPTPNHNNRRPFVPGDVEKSYAWTLINSADPKRVMPPPAVHPPLNDAEKALVKKWIEQGAQWEPHWAFITPTRPALPVVQNTQWAKSDLDRFVLAKLESVKLSPGPEADRPNLIRRATLDLTGLPPTPQEVADFVGDQSPDAYEKVVDRLLASPRYGEHMAVQWLDLARYADSHGYQSDWQRFMWPWRDYVIQSINNNKPFDQFTIEQLAGDLLPDATDEQILATGFNRNHRTNSEGGIIPEEWRIENVIDRTETTGGVWLGLTVGCARCHDHKYDPITQKEFYELTAYFNNVPEPGKADERPANVPPTMKLLNAEQKSTIKQLQVVIDQKQQALKDLEKVVDARQPEWEASKPQQPELPGRVAHFTLDTLPENAKDTGATEANIVPGAMGQAFATREKAYLDLGHAISLDAEKPFALALWVKPPKGANGSVIARMDSPEKDFHGWDVWMQGNRIGMHLIGQWGEDAIKVITSEALPADQWSHVVINYTGAKKASGLKIFVDGKPRATTVDRDKLKTNFHAIVPLFVGKRSKTDHWTGEVDDIQQYDHTLTTPQVASLARWKEVSRIMAVAPTERKPEDIKLMAEFHRSVDPDWSKASSELAEATQKKTTIESDAMDVMVMRDMPEPRQARVLLRGQYDKPGDNVSANVPACLPALPKDAPPNRLALAKWIVSDENPLTARVLANRTWERFFGTGIVKSSENLGQQGDWPSHPELLDFLATELHRLKWDMKAFHREIVTSATYRQADVYRADAAEIDPDNRLLWRAPRLRLTAEEIRDQSLYVSGLLVEKVGGPPVRPYMLQGVWSETGAFGNLLKYTTDKGDGLYRRSLYTIWKRTAAPPSMLTFDAPSREYCTIRRSRTNTPLQALALLNEPTYLEAARKLAERMIHQGGNDAMSRLKFGFTLTLGRDPTNDELMLLTRGLDKQIVRYKDAKDDAEKLLAIGDSPRDPAIDAAELAAYTLSASTLLNLDETITRP